MSMFRSAGQALHFSYTIQAFEVGAESSMAIVMRRHLQELGIWDHQPSTVDFDGLSRMEVRAQATMIRAMVEHKLPRIEAAAIQARYGLIHIRRGAGRREFLLSDERREAIKAVTTYLAPQFDSIPLLALAWLVTRAVAEVDDLRPAFRTIAQMFGGSHATFARHYPAIKLRLAQLEQQGIDRLEPLMKSEGIIPSDEAVAA